MLKLLLLGLLAVYVYRRWLAPPAQLRPRSGAGSARKGGDAVDTVRCEHCGVYLPRSEAIGRGDTWFCSPEHAREFQAQDRPRG